MSRFFDVSVSLCSLFKAQSHLALLRATLLHYGFEGRKATAGNLAFPFSPSDMKVLSGVESVESVESMESDRHTSVNMYVGLCMVYGLG